MSYRRATDHLRKKVVIVGAGTSGKYRVRWVIFYITITFLAHDIAQDLHLHGVDVTMVLDPRLMHTPLH